MPRETGRGVDLVLRQSLSKQPGSATTVIQLPRVYTAPRVWLRKLRKHLHKRNFRLDLAKPLARRASAIRKAQLAVANKSKPKSTKKGGKSKK